MYTYETKKFNTGITYTYVVNRSLLIMLLY